MGNCHISSRKELVGFLMFRTSWRRQSGMNRDVALVSIPHLLNIPYYFGDRVLVDLSWDFLNGTLFSLVHITFCSSKCMYTALSKDMVTAYWHQPSLPLFTDTPRSIYKVTGMSWRSKGFICCAPFLPCVMFEKKSKLNNNFDLTRSRKPWLTGDKNDSILRRGLYPHDFCWQGSYKSLQMWTFPWRVCLLGYGLCASVGGSIIISKFGTCHFVLSQYVFMDT